MSTKKAMGLLFDMTRCGGCNQCVEACMKSHDFPGNPEEVHELSATAYTRLVPEGDYFRREMCRHCLEPSCASACPISALYKSELGPVVYDSSRCMGCRYCMVACPFNVPRFEWNEPVPKVQKCNMCIERLEKGEPTACTQACPNEATICGTREELLAEAHRRIAECPEDYNPHVFGETELGGTSVLLLAPSEIESLAFMEGMSDQPMPQLTRKVLEKIPGLVVMGGATLLALYWITHRRNEVARFEALEAQREAGKESDDARK